MKREEAIAVLRREIEPSVYEDEKSIAEALNMAIEALSREQEKYVDGFPSAESVQGYECDHCVYKWGMKGGDDE
jgi:hypothetical protein